ncbi:SpoVG family protein [Candidatus Phytoplasma sacchari]
MKLNSDVDYNNFHVTSVRIKKKYKSTNRLKGIASITFDNSFAVRNIKIIQGDEGIFIAMPSVPKFPKEDDDGINDNIKKIKKNYPNNKKNADSEVTDNNDEDSPEFLDIAHPINSEVRNKIESVIKKYFEEMIKRSEDSIEIENL